MWPPSKAVVTLLDAPLIGSRYPTFSQVGRSGTLWDVVGRFSSVSLVLSAARFPRYWVP